MHTFLTTHLSRDNQGFVYWKGREVEHFSHKDFKAMHQAAMRLAQRCKSLEERGFPVNARTVLRRALDDAPSDTLWKEALLRYYAFFEGESWRAAIFCRDDGTAVTLQRSTTGCFQCKSFQHASDAFSYLQNQQLAPIKTPETFERASELLHRLGLAPEVIEAAIH